MKVKILIVTHKDISLPKDRVYFPIKVGKKDTIYNSILRDDTGENISDKNSYFSELTAIYWAWKNSFFDCEYAGISHYRRYFSGSYEFENISIFCEKDESLLGDFDIVVPKKRIYNFINVYRAYSLTHYGKDMDMVKDVLQRKHPDYMDSFRYVMSNRSLHLYNMFIMRRELFDEYCSWLFDILFEVEKAIDLSSYSPYQKRVFGFLSERLINIWIDHQIRYDKLKVKELKVVSLQQDKLLAKLKRYILK
jgi:hypothetical protein